MPGWTGETTSLAWIASASETECSGPAPPKPISVKLRGSMPLATEFALMASAILLLMIFRTPSAALSMESPSGSAIRFSIALYDSAASIFDVAAEEMLGIEPSQHDLRVGDGRLLSALTVASRAWHGARRARTDPERAAGIDVGDRSSAGADRVDVDHRHENRKRGHLGVSRVLDSEPAVLDDADVGGGASDIDGDDVRFAAVVAGPARADNAAGRAGQKQADRKVTRLLDRRDASVGLHDADQRRDVRIPQSGLQIAEIGRGVRTDIRVHRGTGEALVLADGVDDLGRATDECVGKDLLHDLLSADSRGRC